MVTNECVESNLQYYVEKKRESHQFDSSQPLRANAVVLSVLAATMIRGERGRERLCNWLALETS